MKIKETNAIKVTWIALVVYVLFHFTACGPAKFKSVRVYPSAPVSTRPAGPLECAEGGVVILVGNTVSIVCNGLQGSQGLPGHNPPDNDQDCDDDNHHNR